MDSAKYSRIVVKVGTNTILGDSGLSKVFLTKLVEEINHLEEQGKQVIIVTSGAIGLGKQRLNFPKKETTLKEQQGLASIGQVDLMRAYLRRFDAFGVKGAQVLLSQHDLLNPSCLNNIKSAFDFLFEHKVVPIVNENDVVAVEELRTKSGFSDNDSLAALLAKQISADLLVMITTRNGLVGKNGKILPELNSSDDLLEMSQKSELGRGGIDSKLAAIKTANESGIDVFISGPDTFCGFADGKAKGTLSKAKPAKNI